MAIAPALFLVVAAALAGAAHAQTCQLTQDVIIGTDSIDVPTATSAQACCSLCNANQACLAFTFDPSSSSCYLKDNTADTHPQTGRISGVNGRAPLPWDACLGTYSTFPFCNTNLSLDARLKDLVARIPLSLAGSQLTARQSSAVANLGLPSYYWGTNAIHGMQNVNCLPNGQCPTSFPAPCGLAASFNMSLVSDMGAVLGRELRAYYNAKQHNSLDTWSPTINVNRDPRWGRNVESPGEDPFLNGDYGSAYTAGLQFGNDSSVIQAVVTLKHWAAYSLENYNGVTRHTFNAVVSPFDLANTYFVPWEKAVVEGQALGVMCSYNELNGVPTCGNPNLTSVLREDWGFQGYITSDSDSIADIWQSHKYEPNAVLATRDGLLAGCDIDSGSTYQDNIVAAVQNGTLKQEYVDNALYRSYKMRFRLGLFDPNITNAYEKITTDVVGCADHQSMSLESARKTMVLLKNFNSTLPFVVGSNVAVIGESTDTPGDILGNYVGPICADGSFNCVPTIFQGIKSINVNGVTTLHANVSDIDGAVAAAQAADVVVLTASNAKDGGGEGQDRYTISLASDQLSLVNAVLAVGKPTVLLLINGGIIAIDSLSVTAPAILEAFMPGVHGAQAIAETVFGINNPGGKMPVTMFYSNYINQVDFLNMSMTTGAGRTYRYFTGTPIYPFGFGLSYTTFEMDFAEIPTEPMVVRGKDDSFAFSVRVRNTGAVSGDEVVLAYVRPVQDAFPTHNAPLVQRQLFAYERIALAPGQDGLIRFSLVAQKALGLVDLEGNTDLHAGKFELIFSRGHGKDLTASLNVELAAPLRLRTFRKFW